MSGMFTPTSVQDVTDRLARIHQHECRCGVGPHEDALHDLAVTDVPWLVSEFTRLREQVTPAVAQIFHQRLRNHERWGDLSIEKRPPEYVGWLPTLGEEFGEVCETLVAEGSRSQLRAELIDLAAVALMWIDSIDRAALASGDEVQS